jgi:hypothetical protein
VRCHAEQVTTMASARASKRAKFFKVFMTKRATG